MSKRLRMFTLAAALLLGACAGKPAAPPPPPPTVATLSISTAKDMNPDGAGQPGPVVVRVFRLADPAAFQNAKYDQLFEDDEKTLGKDLIGTVDILIEPGMAETFDRTLTDRDRWLGFVVTYRDAESAQWRALVPVRPRHNTKVEVEVGARGIYANTVDS